MHVEEISYWCKSRKRDSSILHTSTISPRSQILEPCWKDMEGEKQEFPTFFLVCTNCVLVGTSGGVPLWH